MLFINLLYLYFLILVLGKYILIKVKIIYAKVIKTNLKNYT